MKLIFIMLFATLTVLPSIASPTCFVCNGTCENNYHFSNRYFYFNSSDSLCHSCPSGCEECTDSNTCLKCTPNYVLGADSNCYFCYSCYNCKTVDPKNFTCVGCNDGFYLDQSSSFCLPCASGCNQCISYSNCSICKAGYYLDNSTKSCQACSIGCSQCSSSDNCSACSSGYYYDKTLELCKPCSLGCRNCTNSTNCAACSNGYYMDSTGNCVWGIIDGCMKYAGYGKCTACYKGYVLKNSTCVQCPKGCYDCDYPDTCKRCESGFYYDQSQRMCARCKIGVCRECLNSTFCSKCPDGYAVNKNGGCTACSVANCKSCTLGGAELCDQCMDRFGYDPITNQCVACPGGCLGCSLGTYDNSTGICLSGSSVAVSQSKGPSNVMVKVVNGKKI